MSGEGRGMILQKSRSNRRWDNLVLLSMTLAGFGKDDIDVKFADSQLIVKSIPKEEKAKVDAAEEAL